MLGVLPNIVWIYSDELRADALRCYGNAQFQPRTPHLDGLADRGALFAKCFCNSPVCVPSRVAKLTGQHCERTGVYHNEAAWSGFRLPWPLTTFPEVFAAAGYATADFGKQHVARGMGPFEHLDRDGCSATEITQAMDELDIQRISPDGARTPIGGAFPADRPFPPERVTDNALTWLSSASFPFLMRVSYLQPHTPVCPPPPFDTMYAPELFRDHLTDRPGCSAFEQRFAEVVAAGNLTGRQIQLTQSHYYGLVRWLDAQVGRLLDGLSAMGLDRDTIIVFDADHGASLGEGGWYAKHLFAPHVHRVPRIIAAPGRIEPGRRTDLCEGLDLARTLLGLCGLAAPDCIGGRDLFGDPAPEAVYSTIGFGEPNSKAFPNLGHGDYSNGRGWPRRACIRTERYRLDRNVRIDGKPVDAAEEDMFLCDWLSDGDEAVNLADDPASGRMRDHLTAMLDAHLADSVEPEMAEVTSP